MRQLAPEDAMFINKDKPHNPITISMMWICDQSKAPNGIVRHKEILQHLDDRIATESMFRRRLQAAPLSLDYPYWLEDDDFDLEYHVRHVGLPQPGDWRQLCIFASRVMSRAMDENRPPWEIFIIEGLNNVEGVTPGSFAILTRFHHAYVDGQGGMALVEHLFSDTPDGSMRGKHIEYTERPPTEFEMWARTIPNFVGQAAKSVKAVFQAAKAGTDLYNRLQNEARPDQTSAPRTKFMTMVSPHRVYNSITWSLKDLKSLRQLADGIGLNDIMVSIVGGGMRRYLTHHNELPEDLSLVALLPVGVRPPGEKPEGGNKVSTMVISFGTDIEDPIERVQQIASRTKRAMPLAKEVILELGGAINDLRPAYMHKLSSWAMDKLQVSAKFPSVNTLITNVPGFLTPKFFAGAPVVGVHPLVSIQDGIALTHFILGIEDKITMGVLSDRAVMKDIDFYIDCLNESTQEYFDALKKLEKEREIREKQAVSEKPAVKKSAPKKAPAKKTTVKKAVVKKPVVKKKVVKKTVAKKAAVKKPVVKKATAEKATEKSKD